MCVPLRVLRTNESMNIRRNPGASCSPPVTGTFEFWNLRFQTHVEHTPPHPQTSQKRSRSKTNRIQNTMSVFLKNLDLGSLRQNKRNSLSGKGKKKSKSTGPIVPFPVKLHQMLREVEEQGLDYIISWNGDGKSFQVHHPQKFVSEVLPNYFRCSKMKSFQRQLNFYKFIREITGPQEGSYSHPKFLRGEAELARTIKRQHESKKITESTNTLPEKFVVSDDERSFSEDMERAIQNTMNDISDIMSSKGDLFEIEPEKSSEMVAPQRRESFRDGKRLSFVGRNFFFLPVEFTDLYDV